VGGEGRVQERYTFYAVPALADASWERSKAEGVLRDQDRSVLLGTNYEGRRKWSRKINKGGFRSGAKGLQGRREGGKVFFPWFRGGSERGCDWLWF